MCFNWLLWLSPSQVIASEQTEYSGVDGLGQKGMRYSGCSMPLCVCSNMCVKDSVSLFVCPCVIFCYLTASFGFHSYQKLRVQEKNKTNGSEREGRGGGGKRKKVHNLLAAFLIELPQHFSRGRSARRLDGLIRMHVRTHTHKQTKGRQSYAEKGSASDELSSVVFLRQIRLSCAQAKQKRWWPPLKSFKKASPRAVLLVHKDASQ